MAVGTHKKNKVILVDDDEDLLGLLMSAFKNKGFEVHGISRGQEAMTYLMDEKNTQSACLLVLDRMLPDMDGLQILKTFQARFPNRVPILMLSSLSAEKDMLAGLKEGAVDYVAKPFSLPILMHKALSLIAKEHD